MDYELNRSRQKRRGSETIEERIDALNERAYGLRASDPAQALELSREAERLATSEGYARGIAFALRAQGVLAHYCSRHREALELFDRAEPILEELEEIGALASIADIRGQILRLNGDRPGAHDALRRGLRLAREAGDAAVEAELLSSTGAFHASEGEYDRGLGYFKRALELLEERNIRRGREAVRLNIAFVRCLRGEHLEVSGLLFDILDGARAEGDRRSESKAQCHLAQVYAEMGDLANALRCFLEGVAIAEEIGDLRTQADAYRGIGIIHKRIGDYPRALECAMKSLALARTIGNRYAEASTLCNIGNIHYPMGELDKALEFFEEARRMAEEIRRKDLLTTAIENIGNVLRDRERFDEAAVHFERSRELAAEIGDHTGVVSCTFNIGRMHLDRMEYDQAIASLTEALEAALRMGLKPMAAQIHNDLANAHRARGTEHDVRSALEHLAEYMRINDEVMSRERQRAVTEMHMRMEMEKVEKEREIYRQETRKLQLDVEQKSEELNAMALRLVERNELLARLRGELARAAAETESISAETLTRLREELDTTTGVEEEWNDFQESLRQVHHGFLVELAKRHPSLTPAELKVCALLRTQLSTKEIAHLLTVSTRAVEKLRYRIRKKMELPTTENLTVFLTSL